MPSLLPWIPNNRCENFSTNTTSPSSCNVGIIEGPSHAVVLNPYSVKQYAMLTPNPMWREMSLTNSITSFQSVNWSSSGLFDDLTPCFPWLLLLLILLRFAVKFLLLLRVVLTMLIPCHRPVTLVFKLCVHHILNAFILSAVRQGTPSSLCRLFLSWEC